MFTFRWYHCLTILIPSYALLYSNVLAYCDDNLQFVCNFITNVATSCITFFASVPAYLSLNNLNIFRFIFELGCYDCYECYYHMVASCLNELVLCLRHFINLRPCLCACGFPCFAGIIVVDLAETQSKLLL